MSDVPVVDLARRFEDAGVASLLFTDIGRDGMLKGCNIEATVDLARRTNLPVIASAAPESLAARNGAIAWVSKSVSQIRR